MMTLQSIAKRIGEYARLGKTLEKARLEPRFFTRDRKMSFSELLFFIMNGVNASTQTSLNQFFKNVLKETVHMSQQAMSKARSHFDHSPFTGMFAEVNGMRFSGWHKVRKWNGYQILAVDGSDIAMPNTPEMLRIFGGSGRNADSPTAKASTMLDICNDFIIDACLEPYGTSERAMALCHLGALLQVCHRGKKLLIFDRGYPSLELINAILDRRMSFVMRVRAKVESECG